MTGRQITATRRAYLIAQGLADGKSLTDAYLDTMPGEDIPRDKAAIKAMRFKHDHDEEIDKYMQDMLAERELAARQANIWTRKDALERLKRIADQAKDAVLSPIITKDGDVLTDTDDKVIYKYNPSAAQAELKAIDQATRICGFDAPERIEQTVIIRLAGELDELAK